MRTEALYLDDTVDAADAIARFLHAIEKETFIEQIPNWLMAKTKIG